MSKQIYISVFFLLAFNVAFGQLKESKIKAGLLYKFIGSVDWPEGSLKDTLHVGVVSTDTLMVDEFRLYCKASWLKNIPNRVNWVDDGFNVDGKNVLFFDENMDEYVLDASSVLKNKPVLIITYNSEESILTMINMVKQKRDKTLSYTVNKDKILEAGLMYEPELLLYGGTEGDLKEMYIETSLKLNQRAKQLDSVNKQVLEMHERQKLYMNEVYQAQLRIDSIKETVRNKENDVLALNNLILKKDEGLVALSEELKNQRYQKDKLAKELNNQMDSIVQAESDLEYLNKKLNSLNNLIDRNQQTLNKQKVKIESQKRVLLFAAVSGIGLLITILSIAFALRAKRALTKKLTFLVNERTHDLNLSKQYYKGLFDNSPVAICEFDLSDLMSFINKNLKEHNYSLESISDATLLKAVGKIKIKDINKQTAMLFAVESKEEFVKYYSTFYNESSIPGLRHVIGKLLAGNKNVEFELVRKNKNNSTIHLIESLVLLPEFEGDFTKVVVSMLDITDLKLYEQELLKHRDHLEDLVKERAREILQLNDDLFNANEELQSKNNDLSAKNNQLHKQQEEISALNNELIDANNMLEEQKEELIRTIDQLNETQKQLVESEKMASLGMLTAGVAHEINNPVNFISGGSQALELMLNDLWDKFNNSKGQTVDSFVKENKIVDLEKDIKELTDSINVGVYRIHEIVKSLQNYAQRDTDRYSEVVVEEEVNSALAILKNKYKDRVKVIVDCEKVDWIKTAPVKLNQVVVNILSNAFDAIEKEGEVRVNAKNIDNKFVEISFNDSGIGMTEEEQSKIFDPFFTTKAPGKGTGLGMYLSYGIIEQLKGKIQVSSEKGSGTLVTLILPKSID